MKASARSTSRSISLDAHAARSHRLRELRVVDAVLHVDGHGAVAQRLHRGLEIVGGGAVIAHLGDAGVVGDQHAIEAEFAAQHVLEQRLLADMGTPPGPVVNAGITEGAPAAMPATNGGR